MNRKGLEKIDWAKNIRLIVLLGGIILLLAAQCIHSPAILKSGASAYNYLIKIILAVGSTALIASGVTFVIISGNNDLSTGCMMQFAASIACVVGNKYFDLFGENTVSVISILTPVAVCMVLGMINGILVGVCGLNAFVCTLGMAYIIQSIHVLYNGGGTVYPKSLAIFRFIGKGRIAGIIPFPIVFITLVFLILGFILHKTTIGRKVYAVGGNPTASRFSGIDSKRMIVFVYMISGMMSGVAGVFIASYTESGDMLMGVGKEFDAIVAVVLGGALLTGGAGGMIGTVLGSLFLGVLALFYVQFNVNINVQWVIRGALMLGVILMNGLIDRKQGGKKS
ncbi:hypothetical protein C0033_24980 [Clostridium sp. chh4-2]|uniref:ABC transporter permease n=1 Tax=Clostridium sp. chh4-2 TaxID=2067550 RepID=UPI000CCDF147|nr:ABC transporter permease [Clostridium sp. chh4-2]PNV59232.1 hypothetical protein C0033_24980 [Clostridium sp. chh4-2]